MQIRESIHNYVAGPNPVPQTHTGPAQSQEILTNALLPFPKVHGVEVAEFKHPKV